MKWKRIERDQFNYATGKAIMEMQKVLPIVLYNEIDNIYNVAEKMTKYVILRVGFFHITHQ